MCVLSNNYNSHVVAHTALTAWTTMKRPTVLHPATALAALCVVYLPALATPYRTLPTCVRLLKTTTSPRSRRPTSWWYRRPRSPPESPLLPFTPTEPLSPRLDWNNVVRWFYLYKHLRSRQIWQSPERHCIYCT